MTTSASMSTGARPGTSAASAAGVPAVRLDDVGVRFATKRTHVTALEHVSLDVPTGQFVSIVGPSGCGKSTLLKIVSGLTKTSTGSASLLGNTVKGPRPDIGYVFQRAA